MSEATREKWESLANSSREGWSQVSNMRALEIADLYRRNRNEDIITSACHDEIWLSLSEEEIASIPEPDIKKLISAGCCYDRHMDCLKMFI